MQFRYNWILILYPSYMSNDSICVQKIIFSLSTLFFPVRYVYPLCTGYYSLNGLPKFVSFCFFSPTMGVDYAQQIWILYVTICVVCTLNIYWNISNIFIWQNSFFDEIYEFFSKKCMFSIHLLHFFYLYYVVKVIVHVKGTFDNEGDYSIIVFRKKLTLTNYINTENFVSSNFLR